jgi:hypothetical protein
MVPPATRFLLVGENRGRPAELIAADMIKMVVQVTVGIEKELSIGMVGQDAVAGKSDRAARACIPVQVVPVDDAGMSCPLLNRAALRRVCLAFSFPLR